MTPDEVPTQLVEAAAHALYKAASPVIGESYEDRQRHWLRIARESLAAAFSVCEAREEEGVRSARDGDAFGAPGGMWSVQNALTARRWASPDVHVIRRWVFTTPAEPVPDGETT